VVDLRPFSLGFGGGGEHRIWWGILCDRLSSRCSADSFCAYAEATTTSRDGLELLDDDLVDPTTVARNLESMRDAE
jgi:hypothetical protein